MYGLNGRAVVHPFTIRGTEYRERRRETGVVVSLCERSGAPVSGLCC